MDEPLTRDDFDTRLEAFESRMDARLARALLVLAGFIVGVAGASLAASQVLG